MTLEVVIVSIRQYAESRDGGCQEQLKHNTCQIFVADSLLSEKMFKASYIQGSTTEIQKQFHDFSKIFHYQQCNFHDYLMHYLQSLL